VVCLAVGGRPGCRRGQGEGEECGKRGERFHGITVGYRLRGIESAFKTPILSDLPKCNRGAFN
jgi:hypothetical protein